MNEKNYIITLNNGNKYVLVKKIILENKNYLYLCNINNHSDIVIGELIGDNINMIQDENLIATLISEFSKE